MSKTLKVPTYIKKLNEEFDRLYEREWVNADDDVCMRPLDYPVSYDPMNNSLMIKPTKKITLVRTDGHLKIWKPNIGKYGKYTMLKAEDVETIKDIYEKVKSL